MKKTFNVKHPKIKAARVLDGIIFEVRKYIKRERRKVLPEGVDFWDFDCKFGATEEDAKVVHLSEISKSIGVAGEQGLESFYVEIMAKPGRRTKKPVN